VVSRLGEMTQPASERSTSKLTNTVKLRNIWILALWEQPDSGAAGSGDRTSGPKGLKVVDLFNAGLKTRSTICSTLLAYTGLPLQDTW